MYAWIARVHLHRKRSAKDVEAFVTKASASAEAQTSEPVEEADDGELSNSRSVASEFDSEDELGVDEDGDMVYYAAEDDGKVEGYVPAALDTHTVHVGDHVMALWSTVDSMWYRVEVREVVRKKNGAFMHLMVAFNGVDALEKRASKLLGSLSAYAAP